MDEKLINDAELLYVSYGYTTNFKNHRGLPMPEWENLPKNIQNAWWAAAKALRDRVEQQFSYSEPA